MGKRESLVPLSFKMVVEGKNSGNHEGKNKTVEWDKNMKNGTIYIHPWSHPRFLLRYALQHLYFFHTFLDLNDISFSLINTVSKNL